MIYCSGFGSLVVHSRPFPRARAHTHTRFCELINRKIHNFNFAWDRAIQSGQAWRDGDIDM